MTDNEIIKALKCCMFITPNKKCYECPKLDEPAGCSVVLHGQALDLINSQKAEIDSLKEFIRKNQGLILKLTGEPVNEYNQKVIKEFWEKLKKEKITHKNLGELVYVEDGDNLVNEMT